MKKNLLLLSFLLFSFLCIYAQIPAGYYDSAIGKKQAELKTALHLIVMNATPPSYGSGASSTWGAFVTTDVRPEDGTVWDMYTNNHVAFSGTSAASGMNIEHSLANSWWGGTKNQTYNDLFNLNPSNSTANSSKGSWPIAAVDGTTTYNNGVIKVGKSSSRPGGTIDAWEPADEYKGDFARSYMYMVTSYEDFSAKWTGNSVNQLDNNTYPVFEQWTIDLFLKWCAQDPVSQKEIDRNNAVYKIQGNRNPYIDYPLMAEYVWGKLMSVPFTPDGNVNYPYLITPANGAIVDFGKLQYQLAAGSTVNLKAQNLTGDLSLAISGTNAGDFEVGSSTITKSDAEAGMSVVVNYWAQTVGIKTAQLTITGGGITPVTLALKAICSNDFSALPATNITSGGFTANWTISVGATGYTLNVFSLQSSGTTQAKTLLSEDFLSGLPTGWTSTGYFDNTLTSNMRLASGSNPGKISLPALNLATSGTVLSLKARQYNTDAGAQLTATIDNQPMAVWVTSTTNQDFTVNIPAATATSVIALSAATGSRVYVDLVKVETQGSVQTPVSATGYPKSVGNVMTYNVSSLQADSTYYFTVQPEGNSAAVSGQILVRTGLASGLNDNQNSVICWSVMSDGMLIRNLQPNSQLTVYNCTGERTETIRSTTSEAKLRLRSKGIYIIQVRENQKTSCFKVIY